LKACARSWLPKAARDLVETAITAISTTLHATTCCQNQSGISWFALGDQYNLDGRFLTSEVYHILQNTDRFAVRGAQACSQLTLCRSDTRKW
jgi:hypothetical protein